MPKRSHKEQLLTEGLRVVHERGFASASVRDIVKAAGVPQGSFTNHFVSKEAFGLQILDRYFDRTRLLVERTLRNEALTPMKRLRAYVDASGATDERGTRNGCLIGNFCIEASEHSEMIRNRLLEIFDELRSATADCLRAAMKSGDLPASIECASLADFFIASLQGALLRAKAERSNAPLEVFRKIMFSTVLAKPH